MLSQLYELRKQEYPPISGVESLSVLKAAMTMERNVFNDNLRRLLSSLRKSAPNNAVRKQRILITGSYFDQSSLIELVEQMGAVVVCEDLSNGIKYFEGNVETNEEPIRALARYYLMKSPCARMVNSETRFKNILELVKAYKADGVIYFSLKFCDSNLIDFPYQKNQLEQNGIPVLFLEGERTLVNMGQLKTRIQAFLEMNGDL
jgi:benzoyl-CoA reductase/2-hydroxyglutaryl-CoA dehydratase subunit BcrC/BadD/HgdB